MSTSPDTKKGISDLFSLRATEWVGTTGSLIVHTLVFLVALSLPYFGIVPMEEVLLVLTTVVSLEAIYLAIFIQITVNRSSQSLAEVEKDIDEIQGDVDEIGEDIEELSEDIDEIQEDIGEISEDIDEIQEDDAEDEKNEVQTNNALQKIENNLQQIIKEIEALKTNR